MVANGTPMQHHTMKGWSLVLGMDDAGQGVVEVYVPGVPRVHEVQVEAVHERGFTLTLHKVGHPG